MNLFIRISRSYNELHDILDNIECDKIIVYEHLADESVKRTHIHFVIINSKIKPDAIKTRIRKVLGAIEKTDWSFKSCNEDYLPTITYMSKGVLAPSLCKGFEIQEVVDLTQKWIDPTTQNVKLVDGKLVKEVKEKPTKTKREMLEIVRSHCTPASDTRQILKVIRKVLIDHNQVIGQYKMLDYYDSFMMYDRKEEWLSMMTTKINSRYNI